jgi:hypothetical protein
VKGQQGELMAESREPPSERDEPTIADAANLFDDVAPSPPPSSPQSPPAARGEASGYALEEGELPAEDDVQPLPSRPSAPGTEGAARRAARPSLEPAATVDQVWSRSAEWGPNLVLLALVGAFIFMLVYTISSDLKLAFIVLMIGSGVLLVLSYPIVITLERPVRITPEQAVNDFFGAMCHHAPHYKRMWLLLSSAGRVSSSYASYEGFKTYWKNRLKELRGNRAGRFTPLVFKIEEFKSEKSAGQTSIDAKFTVNIFLRGRQDEGPIESIRMIASLVKGPDKMWYLDKGTLPGARV